MVNAKLFSYFEFRISYFVVADPLGRLVTTSMVGTVSSALVPLHAREHVKSKIESLGMSV